MVIGPFPFAEGLDGIQTDQPAALIKFLKQRNLND